MHLEIDEASCISCGLCEARAPENLITDRDKATAVVVKQPAGEAEIEGSTDAVDYCPTGSLKAKMIEPEESAA